ncbi:nitroreductase [Maribacter polysiphoniae]|uniref:Putative NAD(P)H nitroreductase n=1 Tax=Maribacter polysiphoniae TaxID=429344 RepID=A0A316DZI7_9FLAO|nr:nitroreductase [Maribacter polysiphoniae]MBD1259683.1 nitroreductase [Maribacter polysiphoniae]PWK23176.1 nitroreductase [Maribacter polysiphoniae]
MIFDLIKDRRSVFPDQYVDIPISKKDLDQILEAANWAPSHKKTEPWRFKVMQGESKERLGTFLSTKYQEVEERPKQVKIKKLKENPTKSAVVIAICMQRDPNGSVPEWEEVAAVAMAVQNMWLCCTEIGIGCYWSSPGLITHMDEFFDLAEGEKCLGFLYMGFFEGELAIGQRNPIKDKVVWLDQLK